MPLESATYISDLNTANPAHTDAVSQADSHLRLIKQVLKGTFPSVAGAVAATDTALSTAGTAFGTAGTFSLPAASSAAQTLNIKTYSTGASFDLGGTNFLSWNSTSSTFTAYGGLTATGAITTPKSVNATDYLLSGASILHALVPSGGVIMWSGAATNIPLGWQLCDGTNNAPDLRDRFIVGAGRSYSVGTTGGAASSSTDSQGAHSHTGSTGPGGAYSTTLTSDSQGSHAHGGATQGHSLGIDEMPAHAHQQAMSSQATVATGSGTSVNFELINGISATAGGPYTASTGGGNSHSHPIGSDGAHTHSIPVNAPAHTHGISTDGAHTHSVATLPPYYALCFIMKS